MSNANNIQTRFPRLTVREASVAAEIATGKSNADIAGILGITEKTVKNVCSSVFLKMDVGTGGSVRVRCTLSFWQVGPYAEA